MKKGDKRTLVILTIIVFVLLFDIFILKKLDKYSICAFITMLIFISYYLIGFRKIKSRYDKDIILTMCIYVFIYYIIIYLSGLIIGFTRNVYSLNILSIFKNVLPVILSITLIEVLRYIINSQIKDSKWLLFFSAIVFTLLDSALIIKATNFTNFYKVLNAFGLFILPNLSKSILLTYLSIKSSYKPCLIYRYLMEIPKYILPIIPNFGNYLESVLYILIPMLIFISTFNIFDKLKYRKIVSKKRNNIEKYIYICLSTFLILLICTSSGLFKYRTFVIATGSMTPNINKGDMVVIEKLSDDEKNKLKEGDIIAFNMDNKVVVHRIIKKYNTSSGVFYNTKGDNNNSPDGYLLDIDNIVGLEKFKIRYIGYPTVAIFDRIKGD